MGKPKSAFTLMELLLVVLIIAILVGLSVPVVNLALEAGRKARAAAMVSNLAVALTSYQTDYGMWPSFLGPAGSDVLIPSYGEQAADLCKVLTGDPTAGNAANPRGIIYMQFSNKDLCGKNGEVYRDPTQQVGGFKDPWGKPYYIKLDGSGDNRIEVPDTQSSNGKKTLIHGDMAIWSMGVAGKTIPASADGTGGDQSKYITSW